MPRILSLRVAGGPRSPRMSDMQFTILRFPEIQHGFIGREGSLASIPAKNYVYSEQIHGTAVYDLREALTGIHHLENYDSLVTSQKNVALIVKGADCVPLLFYAPDKQVIATCHAGRAGTEKGAAKLLVQYMTNAYKVDPQQIVCGIGPSICKACYQIDKEKDIHFDLWGNNREQLISAGLRPQNIEIPGWCTSCTRHDKFYSYRKDKTEKRNYGWIMLA
jgi:polyphenol oxidase